MKKLDIVQDFHNGKTYYTLRAAHGGKPEIIARFVTVNEAREYLRTMVEQNPGEYEVDLKGVQ